MIRLIALIAPLALAACLSPQAQCVANASRDLTTLRGLIAQTEANITRGFTYTTETRARPVFTTCEDKEGNVSPCWGQVLEERRVAQAIDLEAERAKLRSMKTKERELAARASTAIAACRAQYPE